MRSDSFAYTVLGRSWRWSDALYRPERKRNIHTSAYMYAYFCALESRYTEGHERLYVSRRTSVYGAGNDLAGFMTSSI